MLEDWKVGVSIGLIAMALLALSCRDFAPGPSLEVEVPPSSLAFQSTTGDSDLCCCRIVGRVINRSTVSVHVTLRFRAFEPTMTDPTGTAIDFLSDVLPGEERPIDGTGLLRPCSTFDRFELEDVDVNGIWFP